MPVYHRTQRLQIFGEKPEIQKLYGSRYRMVVRCVAKNDTKAWYDDNKSQIFADFGSLYSAQMSVDGIDARTGEAYDDMVLVKNEATYTRSGEYVIIFTYETLTDSFVQEAEDKVDFDLNGLKRLTRTIIARGTVAYSSTVGTTTIVGSSPLLTLAQVSEDQLEASEDGFKRIQEVWLESGTLSETLDNVGSQKAKVIETIGTDPVTPTGYSLASKQESDFEGFQTNRFTFLKDNVKLSESEDKVGSQLAITQQWFNPNADKTVSGYSLASKNTSDFEGIETVEFRFLKNNVVLSESEDKVGSQLAITQQWFNPSGAKTESGYSVAREEVSDVDGIPTKRFTFLKDDVELSRSEDKVGSQLAIVTEVFNPTSDPTESGYSVARKEVSDVDGIPTERFTFLKDDVELSRSEDYVGSQKAIITEVFKPSGDPAEQDYSVARKEVSDVDGIPTKRFTFLKDNVKLSRSEDKVGSQLAISEQWFNPDADKTVLGYSLASKNTSDFEGIKTVEFRFLKDNVELSRSEDKVGSQLAITTQVFNPTVDPTEANYSLAREEVSDVEGIPTKRFTFLKDNVVLSVSEDKVGSQNAIVNEVFNPTSEAIAGIDTDGVGLSGYSEANRTESDYEGIKTIRVQFLKDNVELSRSEDLVSSQLAITTQIFNPTSDPTESGYSLARKEESDVDGIPTKRFTFLKDNVELSRNEDYVGSQLAITTQVFNPTSGPTEGGYSLARTEESDVEGIPTKRFTFLKDDVQLSQTEDKVGSQLAISQQWFNPNADKTVSGYSLASKNTSDFEGIETVEFRFLKDDVILSESEDEVGSQNAIVQEVFNGTPATPSGYVVANEQVSDVDGIPTRRYTFLKEDVKLSASEDEVGSQNAIAEQWFKPAVNRGTKAGYSLARKEESDVNGIPTERYTFLKPSILSLQQDFNNGLKRVSVQTFGMTDTSVSAELSEITTDHKLISQDEGDYEGIRTSTFQYQIDEASTEDYELNGLKRVSLIELSVSDFSAQTVGSVSVTAPTTGLYLGTQNIDNGGIIKVRESVWLESGVTSVSTDEDSITDEVVVNALNLSAAQVRTSVTEVTANHSLKSQSTDDFEGLNSFRYIFEIRSTTSETELGDTQIGVNFYTGVQTDGSSDFIIERQYAISSANTASSIKKLIPPEINDPVFDGTGGTQKAYIVDQEVKPNGQDGAVLTRTFAMLPTHLDEWDEMVVRFPGVDRGPFQLDEGFVFRSQPYSEAVPVRICRDFYLSNPQRICRPDEFRPVDKNGNRVTVLTADTVPTADEYIGYVNSGKYLNDRVSIHRWQGDIWERRITQFKAE
jgi:hypothetical protein